MKVMRQEPKNLPEVSNHLGPGGRWDEQKHRHDSANLCAWGGRRANFFIRHRLLMRV